ncbi:TPA: YkgJ family cysteine cluster protein [Salmonella enterica]|uniref:YkgJ family cysteine cluster protein n=1 Tax=Salmonella enterica TaxID=28901 RepID=UPI0009AFE2A9|nr:YkgJ family cysteine cluster protein [Salmonella enterica]HBD1844093.1 YkgJ family cysteine cluster protein [Salmonella enterica]
MNSLRSEFYTKCLNAFRYKSRRQVIIAVEYWLGISEKVGLKIRNIRGIKTVCQKGCSRCCRLHVSLITPCVFFLAEKLKTEFSDSKLYFIKKRLKQRADIVSVFNEDSYRVKCVFCGNSTGQCVIYGFRPEPCRRFIASNEKDCLKNNGSPEQDGTLYYELTLLSTIFSLTAHKNGLYVDSHEMSQALFLALDEPSLFNQWLNGAANIIPGVAWEDYHEGLKQAEPLFKIM